MDVSLGTRVGGWGGGLGELGVGVLKKRLDLSYLAAGLAHFLVGGLQLHHLHLHARETVRQLGQGLLLLQAEPGARGAADQHHRQQNQVRRVVAAPSANFRLCRVVLEEVVLTVFVVVVAFAFAMLGSHLARRGHNVLS